MAALDQSRQLYRVTLYMAVAAALAYPQPMSVEQPAQAFLAELAEQGQARALVLRGLLLAAAAALRKPVLTLALVLLVNATFGGSYESTHHR